MGRWRADRAAVALVLVLAAGAVLRIWGLAFGLPHDLARPDEEKIRSAALTVFQGDPNPHLFLYPSLFIYATSAGYGVLYLVERAAGVTASRAEFVRTVTADPSSLHLIARAISAACGIGTIAVIYLLAASLFSRRIALVAAALTSAAFLLVRDSHFGATDVPVAFAILCALLAAARCAIDGTTASRTLAAGLAAGLAASTKYTAAAVVLPALVALWRGALGRPRLSAIVRPAALYAGSMMLAFVAATPFSILDSHAFAEGVAEQFRIAADVQHGSILDPARAVITSPGWAHYFAFTLRHGVGPSLLAAAAAGAIWLASERSWKSAFVLTFPIAYYAVMSGNRLVYARYMVPLVPFLCLTAAYAIDHGIVWLTAVSPPGFRVPLGPAITLAAAAIALPTAARAVAFDRLVSRTDSRVRAAHWIEQRFPAGATIYQTGAFYGFVQPRPNERYAAVPLDRVPDLIVRLDSPLVVFNQISDRAANVLAHDYVAIAAFKGIGSAADPLPIFDQQDAFYVPFANLTSVPAPGPTVQVFARRTVM